MTVLDAVAAGCLLCGAVLSFAAGLGVLRFPDLLSRMHSATKPQVLGLLLILTGTALRLGTVVDITTLVLVGAFQLATGPVAAHMVGRSAYRAGRYRPDLLVTDEFAEDRRRHRAGPARTGPDRAEHNRAGPDRAEHNRAGPDRAEPDRARPDRAEHNRAGPDRAAGTAGDQGG